MITSFNELSIIRCKHLNRKIVLVGGCFDLIHTGHLAYLEQCRKLGDMLIVAVSSDKRIKQRKGDLRPIISEENRVIMLSALRLVDYALVAPNPQAGGKIPTVMVIEELRPNIFATADSRLSNYKDELALIGVEALFVNEVRLTSTTDTINRIKDLY